MAEREEVFELIRIDPEKNKEAIGQRHDWAVVLALIIAETINNVVKNIEENPDADVTSIAEALPNQIYGLNTIAVAALEEKYKKDHIKLQAQLDDTYKQIAITTKTQESLEANIAAVEEAIAGDLASVNDLKKTEAGIQEGTEKIFQLTGRVLPADFEKQLLKGNPTFAKVDTELEALKIEIANRKKEVFKSKTKAKELKAQVEEKEKEIEQLAAHLEITNGIQDSLGRMHSSLLGVSLNLDSARSLKRALSEPTNVIQGGKKISEPFSTAIAIVGQQYNDLGALQ